VSSSFDVSVITPTGDRPECLALLGRWMAQQEFKGTIQWIIVDDGRVASAHMADPFPSMEGRVFFPRQIIHRVIFELPQDEITLGRNLLSAFEVVDSERILIWEDDDYYAPDYIRRMTGFLDASGCSIVSFSPVRHYNVRFGRWKVHQNSFGPLCFTAFRPSGIALLTEVIKSTGGPFYDQPLWDRSFSDSQLWPGRGVSSCLSTVPGVERLGVQIKGMPGRRPIGGMHTGAAMPVADRDIQKLIEWLGPTDAALYSRYRGADVCQTSS